MSFDPQRLRALGGRTSPSRRPVKAAFLLRVGAGAGVAAALCDVVLLLIAGAAGWDVTVDGQAVRPLSVILVCVIVGLMAALAAYVAARVTKHPGIWTALAGSLLWLASIQDLPAAVVGLHTIAALWIVGWLTRAVWGGSHLRHGG